MDEQNNKPDYDGQPDSGGDDKTPEQQDYNFNIEPQINPIGAGIIGLVIGFFLYQLLGSALTVLIVGLDLEAAPVNSIRLMTMAGQILFMLLPALILTKWVYTDVTKILRIYIPNWKEIMLFLLGMAILIPLLQYFLFIQDSIIEQLAQKSVFIESLKSLFDKANELVEKTLINLITPENIFDGFLVIVVIAIVPAICEEALFRGYIQRSFEFALKPVWAALLTAFFFGIFHLNPMGIIPLIALGFYFGFSAYKSNSIFIPVILHFLNNLSSIILFFIYGDEMVSASSYKDVDLTASIVIFFVLAVLFIGVIALIRRYYKQQKNI